MAKEYPYLAFTFKGRIKSLIRAEAKFNGYIVKDIYKYYIEHGTYPPVEEVKKRLQRFRDLIAYRIVISMPRCHLESEEEREAQELKCIYEIANVLPGFLEKRGFTVIPTGGIKRSTSPLMKEEVKDCFRVIFPTKILPAISLCTLHFLITVPTVIWKYRFGPKIWMIRQRLEVPITRIMKNGRRKKGADATRSRKGNVSGSMKRMSVVSACSIWIFPDWMSICSLPWTTA